MSVDQHCQYFLICRPRPTCSLVWPDSVMGEDSKVAGSIRGRSRLFYCQVTTVGKLFKHLCLCHLSKQYKLVPQNGSNHLRLGR